jgi:UDP-4-amino-4-deoxy-L-arabinose formyltransferase/UDP-glucuronic acid dehydrogenase (UDP-4-keto-hexauronic acid decarboxylating)
MRIIENRDDRCNGQIFNIGNPLNEATVKDLAIKLKTMFTEDARTKHYRRHSEIIEVYSRDFYGEGYQDTTACPSIRSERDRRWEPLVDLDTAPETLDYYLETSLPGETGR